MHTIKSAKIVVLNMSLFAEIV